MSSEQEAKRTTPKEILIEILEEAIRDHMSNYFMSDDEISSVTQAYMGQLENRVMCSTDMNGIIQILVSDP